ncbi:MFS transporter [Streptomyces sp. p1417]|uniref:MFS transporter n=1 Tax=Streptomyces typhae TaxID=2681492 RepID=A0A6L6X300_9ACTN|nr:MFS transporter [Streptomyces typhae]MVO88203.1 MFS transporter [Streptomyces typhae]
MPKRYRVGRYLTGATAARTGDEMSGPALLLVGLSVTGSASTASALLSGITLSAAVGGPVFGALLDRAARPGRLLAAALAAYSLALLVILLGLGRLPLPAVLATALCGGLLGPALAGGWTSQLPGVSGPEHLPRATALDALTYNFAALAGPALAGAVAMTAGAPVSVVVSLALIVLALPAAWTLPQRAPTSSTPPPATSPAPSPNSSHTSTPASPTTAAPPAPTATAFSPGAVLADLRSGFAAIGRVRPLARATLTSVISYVGVGMLVACTPLLGEHALGTTDSGTFLLATLSAASLAANALLARRPGVLRPDATILASTLALAGALLLAATLTPLALFAAMVVAGAGAGPQLTALFAVRHREAPAPLRGQIFTTGASLKITGYAIGAGLGGPLATWSLPGALLVAAGFEALAALGFMALSRGRRGPQGGRGVPHTSEGTCSSQLPRTSP